MLFNLGGKIDIATMLFEHGWMSVAKTALVGTGRYVNNIYIRLNHLGNANAFSQIIATFEKFGSTHAEFNRESRSNGFSD